MPAMAVCTVNTNSEQNNRISQVPFENIVWSLLPLLHWYLIDIRLFKPFPLFYVYRISTREHSPPLNTHTQMAFTRHEILSNLIVVHSDNHHTYRAHLFPIQFLCDRLHLLHMYFLFCSLRCRLFHRTTTKPHNEWIERWRAVQFKYSVFFFIFWLFSFWFYIKLDPHGKKCQCMTVLLVGNIQTQLREPAAFISPSFETKKKNGKFIWLHWKLHSSG